MLIRLFVLFSLVMVFIYLDQRVARLFAEEGIGVDPFLQAPNEILLIYREGVSPQDKQSVQDLLVQQGISLVSEETLPDNRQVVLGKMPQIYDPTERRGLMDVFTATDDQPDEFDIINELHKHPAVKHAEPNYFTVIARVPNEYTNLAALRQAQWGLDKIQAPEAWEKTTGSNKITIAIIDTGADLNHEDLKANLVQGRDFVDINMAHYLSQVYADGSPVYSFFPWEDYVDEDDNPSDQNGHGTHVSGTAAAVTNNSRGVSGVCWNCKIMPLRAGFSIQVNNNPATPVNESGTYGLMENDDVARAIYYAADNGAKVINMSWGNYSNSLILKEAIDYAYKKGVLLVAAAGNEGLNMMAYPAAYSNVIGVAATDSSDRLASWGGAGSNYGNWVSMAAPGSSIKSTVRANAYENWSGTSMAAPFVSGTAGLILAANPGWTVEQVSGSLINSADSINVSGIGSGRLNARAAVNYELNTMSIATDKLPDGELTADYNFQIILRGGVGSKKWEITTGTLPKGLKLDSKTGLISGKPTELGSKTFTIQITDSQFNPQVLTKQFIIKINPLTLSLVNTVLPAGQTGEAYSVQLQAQGGTKPYVWVLESGKLPEGLSLDAQKGLISGTPSQSVSQTVRIKVLDSFTPQSSGIKEYKIEIYPPELVIRTDKLPAGSIGLNYSQTLFASGGTDSKRWILKSGNLPNGLSLGNKDGKLSGIPKLVGVFTFEIEVKTNDGQIATKSLTLEINADSLHPNGTLIMAPGSPSVYLVDNYHKRWFPSAEVFLSHGFRWGDIVRITDKEMKIYPQGDDMRIRTGTIVKGSGSNVYKIVNDQKKHFPTADVYLLRGYDWDMIWRVDDRELSSYPEGLKVGAEAVGRVLKGKGSEVYYVEEDSKRHFPNAEVFLGLGYTWRDIKTISDTELSKFQTGKAMHLIHYPGDVVKTANNPSVFLLENLDGVTHRRVFQSAEVYLNNGFRWQDIVTISNAEMNSYPQAHPMIMRDGSLITGSNNGTYVVEHGQKRAFMSAEDFDSRGYSWDTVTYLPDHELFGIPETSQVQTFFGGQWPDE